MEATKEFKLFAPIEDDLSQYSYAAFLRTVAQWKEQVLKGSQNIANDSASGSKQSSNPLDDEIHCMLELRDEHDWLKALFTMSEHKFDGVMGSESGAEKSQGRTCEERPLKVSDVLVAAQVEAFREICLCLLGNHVLEVKEDDDRFRLLGSHLCISSRIFKMLLQEIRDSHRDFSSGTVTLRTSNKIFNILILLQCMAASKDTWGGFMNALTPNCLKPLILTNHTDNHYETIRMASLSVIFLICQHPEEKVANWALDNDVILIYRHSMQTGSYASKLVALLILESLLKSKNGISNFCSRKSTDLEMVIETFANLVTLVATAWAFSPLFMAPIIRCYLLLAKDRRAREWLKIVLPSELQSDRFNYILKGLPELEKLWQLLLFTLEKTKNARGPFLRGA
ncbi:hypothetical protein GOP47_0000217 [Adiantum capillus-veneris]|uniref:Uncharacterized protein n=1 Tax=Adiantum capillus-veneris TaxID=13818 RepID=A0A9D4VEJ4_ADICA|nr:hypothetical protein GOP47_0000217 [Adiantum capillus-veneris]